MIVPIVKEPNKILHQRATEVAQITDEIQTFIDSMIATMHTAEGVGLAANQVGSNRNILVASPDGKRGAELVLINPIIIKQHGRSTSSEGCLSVPGISAEVTRSAVVTARGLNRKGTEVMLEATGLLAKILQHEVDHLRGRLYLDRLRFWRRRRLLNQYKAFADTLKTIDVDPPNG